MPLFEYECKHCGCEFEELLSAKEADTPQDCKRCGKPAEKKMSSCAAVFAGGAPTETIDTIVGRSAEQRWKQIHERDEQRRKGQNLQPVEVPKTNDGKYMPVMGLGGKQEKDNRKEYTAALKGHVEDRNKRGLAQFNGPGAF